MSTRRRRFRRTHLFGVAAENAAKVSCIRGHLFDPTNTRVWTDTRGYVHRQCRRCDRGYRRKRLACRQAPQTHQTATQATAVTSEAYK